MWGGQIVEIPEFVTDGRPWLNAKPWPISRDELRYYYDQANAEELFPSEVSCPDARRNLLGPGYFISKSFVPFASKWMKVRDFSRIFREALKYNKNLTLVTKASVSRVLIDEALPKASGVLVRTTSGEELVVHAKDYVICAGGIENCRLLLNSFAFYPNRHFPGAFNIGHNFQDHLSVEIGSLTPPRVTKIDITQNYYLHNNIKYQYKLTLTPEKQSAHGILDVALSLSPKTLGEKELGRAFIFYQRLITGRIDSIRLIDFAHFIKLAPTLLWHKFPSKLALWRRPAGVGELAVHASIEQEPNSQNRLVLSPDRDVNDVPRVELKFDVSEREFETAKVNAIEFAAFVEEHELGKFIPNSKALSSLDAMKRQVKDAFHHMGGTRMGVDPADSVVDANLALHCVPNLYVCGSSTFPAAGCANPTHTIIALALRLADHLAAVGPESGRE